MRECQCFFLSLGVKDLSLGDLGLTGHMVPECIIEQWEIEEVREGSKGSGEKKEKKGKRKRGKGKNGKRRSVLNESRSTISISDASSSKVPLPMHFNPAETLLSSYSRCHPSTLEIF